MEGGLLSARAEAVADVVLAAYFWGGFLGIAVCFLADRLGKTPLFKPILRWGKTMAKEPTERQGQQQGSTNAKATGRSADSLGQGGRMHTGRTTISGFLKSLTVPKGWFTHFYVLGFAVHLSVMLLWSASRAPSSSPPRFVLGWLLLLQVGRRLFECLFVHRKSRARMHLAHYLIGITYYPMLSLLTYKHPVTENALLQAAGGVLFALAFALQFYSHIMLRILSDRAKKRDDVPIVPLEEGSGGETAKYYPPKVWPFTWVSSAHYFAEILIYAAMLTLAGWDVLFLGNLVFVVFNLSIGAVEAHRLYRRTDPAFQARYAILPPFL